MSGALGIGPDQSRRYREKATSRPVKLAIAFAVRPDRYRDVTQYRLSAVRIGGAITPWSFYSPPPKTAIPIPKNT